MPRSTFAKSVFVNCPFDKDYVGLFQSLVFTIQYLGFQARTSYEANDSSEVRILKLVRLIRESKYGIHDLSRCRAQRVGEYARMNMPLELGIDYGCKQYRGKKFKNKKLLVLDSGVYRLKKVISDLSGSDFRAHSNKKKEIIRVVSDWLIHEARAKEIAPTVISHQLEAFLAAHYFRLKANGHSIKDIESQSAERLRRAMREWIRRNKK